MWLPVVVLSAFLTVGTYAGAVDLTFPPEFKFGAATAAYQVEGAWNVSDKGENIWDRYTHDKYSMIPGGATGDVACDSYHLWEKDIEIAANLSLDFYRFSIDWSRLLPTGFPNHVSEDGKAYYNKLIDGLLAKGIEPVVTLYHWDLPQRLQDLGTYAGAVDLTFPPEFKFGAATAAYQVEGAWNVSDKGENIWDRYTHDKYSMIPGGATGDVACDSYHLWEKDIEIAANLSLDFYRFSIDWSRLLPTGFPNHVSEDGKAYYNKLIDGLLAKGIEPVVTLYHWDLPQRLQDLGGWTNPYVVNWFADYADVAFSLYGDRVKTWITINEPMIFCDASYTRGLNMAPGIRDEDVAPHLCAKNVILAHAKAYRIYDEKYRAKFNGKISLANHLVWTEPLTDADIELAETCVEYTTGRYSQPIFSKEGGWPKVVEDIIAENSRKEGFSSSRLPAFTAEEIEFVKGTFDFYGLNHYTSRTARKAKPGEAIGSYPLLGAPELGVVLSSRPEWPGATSSWLFQYPLGLRKQMAWIKKKYGDIPILITENGFSTSGGSLEDDERIQYYKDYLKQVLLSIKEDGVNVIGYTAWTLIDNFEWWDGYSTKFGLYEVDFSDPLRPRTPRKSAQFYADLIRTRSLEDETIKTEL